MKNEIPEVEEVVRILSIGKSLIKYNDNSIYSEDLILTEPSFFDVFDFRLKKGDLATCIKNPNTAILTEKMAKKIFGSEDPIGKTFSAIGTDNIEVTGILEEEKRPSHFELDVVISINPSPSDSNTIAFLNSWQSISIVEYAVLKDPTKKDQVINEMDSLLRRNNVIEAWKTTLQPLDQVHLDSGEILYDGFNKNKGNIKYVQSLALVALIILLIASFNYMNLSTARSAKRAKEVGIRKTSGAHRKQLIFQYLMEAIVQVVLSLILAFGLVDLINCFYPFIEYSVFYAIFSESKNIMYILLLIIGLGLLSGIYPALVLSSFSPMVVLKGKFETGKKGLMLRRSLVFIQFIATFVMILGTIVVIKQLKYSLSKDLGFNKEQIMTIQINNQEVLQKFEPLKAELEKIPGVKTVSTSGSMPGFGFGRRSIVPEGTQTTDTWIVSAFSIDENYLPMMEMELIEGENFRKDISQDPVPLIVNQSFLKATNWEKGLNKTITLGGGRKAQVIGVVKDFHFTSLRHKIEPVMMNYRSGANGVLSIKIDGNNIGNTVKAIESSWKTVNGSIPFEYTFFDESFAGLFEKEKEFSTLFFRFTLLSIFIAILGLFGLAAYSAEQRTKEIGIRKTFGGTTLQMVVLQLHEYTRLILLAIIIGIPAGIIIMKNWLQGFEYRINLGVMPFLYSVLIIVVVTVLTVSIQSYKAAEKNPSESLKYE